MYTKKYINVILQTVLNVIYHFFEKRRKKTTTEKKTEKKEKENNICLKMRERFYNT
jgi:hypothetical protein